MSLGFDYLKQRVEFVLQHFHGIAILSIFIAINFFERVLRRLLQTVEYNLQFVHLPLDRLRRMTNVNIIKVRTLSIIKYTKSRSNLQLFHTIEDGGKFDYWFRLHLFDNRLVCFDPRLNFMHILVDSVIMCDEQMQFSPPFFRPLTDVRPSFP